MKEVKRNFLLPAEAETKTFADIGNFLNTSVSAGLSQDKMVPYSKTHDT